jgi:hypothetical protein
MRDRGQQRGLEPAAVLVGAFEVQVDRRRLRDARAEHAGMGDAGVEPDIQDVGDLLVVARLGAEQLAASSVEPGIDAALLDAIGHLLDQLGVRGCSSPVSRAMNSAIGTPQVRWREMHQSGGPRSCR